MEEDTLQKTNRVTTAWIAVLAVAITCCALLFLVFAKYLDGISKNLTVANQRLTVMEDNESLMLHEIQALHKAMASNNTASPPPAPTPAPVTAPSTPAPAAATPPQPAPATDPSAANPSGTPTSSAPPATSKTAVPEVPPTTH